MSRRIGALLVVIGATLLGGCTSSPSNTSGTQSASASRVGSQLPTLPPGSVRPTMIETIGASTPAGPGLALGDADNGKTLSVAVGEQVTVTLSGGTDWKFTDPKPASVLTPASAPVVSQANGTVAISFRAAKPGTAVATATRGSVSYQITIIVQ